MEKLIWEYNSGDYKWVRLHPDNLDENGNLKGMALSFYEQTKTWPDPERGDCSSYWFRQIPESLFGIGDSMGIVKVMLDINDDVSI